MYQQAITICGLCLTAGKKSWWTAGISQAPQMHMTACHPGNYSQWERRPKAKKDDRAMWDRLFKKYAN